MRKRFTGFTNIAMMQIERQIEGIAERLTAVQPEALLLLGSAARNELSYRLRPDGSVEFFSDLEFLLVVPRRLSGEARRRNRPWQRGQPGAQRPERQPVGGFGIKRAHQFQAGAFGKRHGSTPSGNWCRPSGPSGNGLCQSTSHRRSLR